MQKKSQNGQLNILTEFNSCVNAWFASQFQFEVFCIKPNHSDSPAATKLDKIVIKDLTEKGLLSAIFRYTLVLLYTLPIWQNWKKINIEIC